MPRCRVLVPHSHRPLRCCDWPTSDSRIVPTTFVGKASAFLACDGLVLSTTPTVHLICVF